MTNFIVTAPLHEETRGKVVTNRKIIWCAFREGTGEYGVHGYGLSEKEAIADLLEKERGVGA